MPGRIRILSRLVFAGLLGATRLLAFGMRQGRAYLEVWNADHLRVLEPAVAKATDGDGAQPSMSSRQRP